MLTVFGHALFEIVHIVSKMKTRNSHQWKLLASQSFWSFFKTKQDHGALMFASYGFYHGKKTSRPLVNLNHIHHSATSHRKHRDNVCTMHTLNTLATCLTAVVIRRKKCNRRTQKKKSLNAGAEIDATENSLFVSNAIALNTFVFDTFLAFVVSP